MIIRLTATLQGSDSLLFIMEIMFLARWVDCLSQVMNCHDSTSETSPMAHTSVAPLTRRNLSTITDPLALRKGTGIYEELGIKPNVGTYISVISLSPLESVNSFRPFGSYTKPMTFISSLTSTFRFSRAFNTYFDTLAGLSSRIISPLGTVAIVIIMIQVCSIVRHAFYESFLYIY